MFNFFRKKSQATIKVIDKIWISENAKLDAFKKQWDADKNTAWIFWFDDTLRRAESVFAGENLQPLLLTTRGISAGQLTGRTVIFAEHYPLRQKEADLFEKLQLKEATVWSAMDEPLFKHFGAEKITGLMRQLGMKEDEMIEHNYISKSIIKAQEKISSKITIETSAQSQEDWLKKNLREPN